MQKPQRSYNGQQQSFSLLKNIEVEQQNRRNKKNNYYNELRNQIQLEKQQKKRKKQQQAERSRLEQEKIMRDNQILRQRAEMERQQQTKKKGIQQNSNIPTNDKPQNRIKIQQSQKPKQSHQQSDPYKNFHSRLKTSQSQKDASQLPLQAYQSINPVYSMSQLPSYLDRLQSQSINYLPQRKYMDSYFQQLLGERRKFEQQANGISELNRMLNQQKVRGGRIQSRGLNDLKKLQALLDQKGADYKASYSNVKNHDRYDQYNSLKRFSAPSYQNSRVNQNGWRKLD